MHPRARTMLFRDKPAEGTGGASAAASALSAEAKPQAPTPGSSPEPKAGQASTPSPASEPAAPKADWRDSRIAELTAKLNEAKRNLHSPAVPPQLKVGESAADFESRVAEAANQRATVMHAMKEWDAQCNTVADAGVKQFGQDEFFGRYNNLKQLVNEQDADEVNVYTETLAVAMETGKGHELLYKLGAEPQEWKRLMALPPVKRAMEMAKLASKLESAPEPSGAPKPIVPVGSSGIHYDGIKPDDPKAGMKLDKKAWMEQRNKQARERGLQ